MIILDFHAFPDCELVLGLTTPYNGVFDILKKGIEKYCRRSHFYLCRQTDSGGQ